MNYMYHYNSPLGTMIMVSDGVALMELDFAEVSDCKERLDSQVRGQLLPVFADTCRWLDLYFAGKKPDFMPPISLQGTPFREAVWDILRTIPYGETTTYGEIAAKIAKQRGVAKMSAQAVGGAVGHNPLAIIVPCHRVIGQDGSLTGYAGGIYRKEWLLKQEAKGRK